MSIKIDDKSFQTKTNDFALRMKSAIAKGVAEVADEILRLSSYEVPHDTGMLQASGHREREGAMAQIVGYNKVYAARLHEHPEYNFQKGRKGKYLEDPIKRNLAVFLKWIGAAGREAIT